MEMRELTFTLLRKCNRACSYCGITCNHGDTTEDAKILDAFNTTLRQYSREEHLCINLSGGEPGLLSKGLMRDILHSIASVCRSVHLNIFTNGKAFWIEEIMQADVALLSPVIRSYRFIWHCTTDLQRMERICIPRKLQDKVLPVVVLTAKDIDYLDSYLRKNRHATVKPFFAIHNHAYRQEVDTLGVPIEAMARIISVLEGNYGRYALRSLEVPYFITREGNPPLAVHRDFCSKNLPEYHHVYDISSGEAKRFKCCIALSSRSDKVEGEVDCSKCVNYQQFYENALASYGYTETLNNY